MAFYGLTFNSISLGNKYLNFLISAAIELPSFMIAWICLDRMRLRLMTAVPLLVGGGVILLIMAVPSESGKYSEISLYRGHVFPKTLTNDNLSSVRAWYEVSFCI